MRKTVLLLIVAAFVINGYAQEVIPLYAKDSLSVKSLSQEYVERVFDVSIPTLTLFRPQKPDSRNIAIIICPGGGYGHLSMEKEGYAVACELNELGITAFVLKYRLPASASDIDSSLTPLADAQKAIIEVRTNAKEWGIEVEKLGIMGFSAGGHLAASASTLFDEPLVALPGNISLRPDFTILGYPVISMKEGSTHAGSKNKLIGNAKNQTELIAKFSAEENVTPNTPPAILFLAADDQAVIPENAILYFQSLQRNKVSNCSLIIYPEGGHGFGLHLPNENQKWIHQVNNWLEILYKK